MSRRCCKSGPLGTALALLVFAASPIPGAEPHPPATPGSYLLHPGLELSLFAREPDVVDPVALAFDEHGRAWVVEMRDYPYGFGPERRPGSTVRVLEDTDADGRADRSTLFAEGLSFATSITPWRDGVLVAAPPDILYLADTNRDGRADVREVVIAGFRLGVTDSNVNGLRFAFDNWIHGANGGNGGSLQSPRRPGAVALRLGDQDFRLQPDTGVIERTTHTGGGFGLVFDNWGRSFTTYNINHVQQRVADAAWFTRHPGLPPVETTHSISDHGDMARIFPVSPAQTRPNHPEQAGHFSAAGGVGLISHPGWPAELQGSFLVCDVVGNLVHRDVLRPDGPIFRASRPEGEPDREFFASRDPQFRPVGLEQGPDGALYLLDMQRAVIEHPDYIPKKVLETQDIRAGDDRGRIYRIAPRGWTLHRELPGAVTPAERVDLLASSNAWTRLTAQRLLVTQPDHSLIPALRQLAEGDAPVGRLHALFTLDAYHALDTGLLLKALADPIAPLRVQALHLLSRHPARNASVQSRIMERLADPDAEVRFTAALVAGSFDSLPVPPLGALLRRDHAYPWTRRAVFAALGPRTADLVAPLLDDAAFWEKATPELHALAGELAEVAAGTRSTSPVLPSPLRTLPASVQAAFLEGTARGLARRTDPGVEPTPEIAATLQSLADAAKPPEVAGAALALARRLGLPRPPGEPALLASWMAYSTNTALPADRRAQFVRRLALADLAASGPVLQRLLRGTEPAAVQQAALDVLREHREPEVGQRLVDAWPALPPALRPAVVNLLVYRAAFHEALLGALDRGALQVGELNLDLEHRRELLRKARPAIRERAAKFMSDEEYSNRAATVEAWLAKLPSHGDAARGKPVFERLCAQCHRAAGLGHAVGPDLSALGHRSVEDLLSNILDPNMAMNPAFVAYTAELHDGESESGVLVAESERSLSLAQAGGRVVEIPRSRIRDLKSAGRSLMPDGLESGLSPTDLRDLIAFLQAP